MSWIRTILREIFGLFVDDGSFAVLILAWLGIVLLVSPHLNVPSAWEGAILFGGLALILTESVTRRAKR